MDWDGRQGWRELVGGSNPCRPTRRSPDIAPLRPRPPRWPSPSLHLFCQPAPPPRKESSTRCLDVARRPRRAPMLIPRPATRSTCSARARKRSALPRWALARWRSACVPVTDASSRSSSMPVLTQAQACSSFCPAAQAKIYNGGSIEQSVGPDGRRYTELATAFAYREKIVPGCTCNGKDLFGLVTTPVGEDPTLRPGDIVATNAGLMAYNGSVGSAKKQTASFTPVSSYSRLSGDLRRKL